jgi:hypothetical protein
MRLRKIGVESGRVRFRVWWNEMTESVRYFGTLETIDGQTPLIARANDGLRDATRREASGGVIFTDAKDMPSLEVLLAVHGVLYAVLEAPAPDVEERTVDLHVPTTWRDEVSDRLAFNLDIADRDEVMDEDFVFLASLDSDHIDAFLDRAHKLLSDESAKEQDWQALVEEESLAAEERLGHTPFAPIETGPVEDTASESAPLLLSLDDLDIEFSRGAFGGPRPLADVLEN